MNLFRRRRGGQVTVELLLILPVFMLMIFFILEYGNIAYHTLLANHASYEFARIGAMAAVKEPSGQPNNWTVQQKISQAKRRVFGVAGDRIKVTVKMETTGRDPLYSPHRHQDIVVELKYPVKLIFPGSSFILASKPRKEGIRMIETEARMPVEKMYLSTDKQ